MTTDLITVNKEGNMAEVVEIFTHNNIHHLPVVSGEYLEGLITTSDLLWINKKLEEYDQLKITEVMTTKLATLEPNEKIGTAAQMFLRNWFHAVPIVDESRKLLGIVTTFDVLKYNFRKEYPNEEI